MSAPRNNEHVIQDMIDAVRADTPSETQWRAAQHNLIERIRRHESNGRWIGGTGASATGDSRRPSSRLWPRPVVWGGAGVAVAASILAALFLPRSGVEQSGGVTLSPQAFGHVAVAHGHCVRVDANDVSHVLSAGDAVTLGDQVQVASRGGLCLRLEDSTTLWLGPGTELMCVGPRSAETATVRLVRGEVRADVARSEKSTFSVETPAATLRVLGTQFHCRVLPAIAKDEEETMKRLRNALQKAITVVTVLSGSVAVQAGNVEAVLTEGQRTEVVAGSAPGATERVERLDYTREWLGEPGRPDSDEVLMFVPIRQNLLHALWAVDEETGAARHVCDFVGVRPNVIQQMGPDLALVDASSVLFAFSGLQPVGSAGRPLVKAPIMLVNLESGEKLPMVPLEDCDPIYAELSPDRRRLAFVGSRDTAVKREHGLFVLDLETFELSLVLEGGLRTRPHWSPDSRWLAISKSQGYTNDHWIVLADTLTGEVVETGLQGADACFLPDGQHLVFCAGFARGGSWVQGVPSSGNLFVAALPAGPAEKVTFLAEGGAVHPSVSPDGSRVAYWEYCGAARLRVLQLDTLEDRVVWEADSPSLARWIDGSDGLAVVPLLYEPPRGWQAAVRSFLGEDSGMRVTMIHFADDAVAARSMRLHEPALSPEQMAAASALADQLLLVFRAYHDGVGALELHRIEAGQEKLKEARDLLSSFSAMVPTEGADGGLSLSMADLRPYQDVLTKEAEMSVAERSVAIVRTNLRDYVPALLSMYYGKHGEFPQSMEALARWAAGEAWQINHIRSGSEQARRLFVIPGDDPDTVTTSYRLIESAPKEGRWIVQTPVLSNGREYVVTYRYAAAESRVLADLTEAH